MREFFCVFLLFFSTVNCDVIDLVGHPFLIHYGAHHETPVTSSLPEIIVNRAINPFKRGYVYETPSTQPTLNDEYIPPPVYDYLPPTTSLSPPVRDEPTIDNSYLPPLDGLIKRNSKSMNGTKIEIRDMKCLQAPNGYFKSVLVIHKNLNEPVIDVNDGGTRCEVKLHQGQILINIVSEDFKKCGIHPCGLSEVCLNLRFPQVRGLRTSNDLSLTLQCKLPERVVAKMHSLRMALATSQVNARSNANGAIATGGGQQLFHSKVGLFRKNSENLFTKPLHAGDMVTLGEEILLRAQVRQGDGMQLEIQLNAYVYFLCVFSHRMELYKTFRCCATELFSRWRIT